MILLIDSEPRFVNAVLKTAPAGAVIVQQAGPAQLAYLLQANDVERLVISARYLDALEALSEKPNLPGGVIIVTGCRTVAEARRARRAGATDYQVKDFRPEVLSELVEIQERIA